MNLVERLARFCQFITKVSLLTTIIVTLVYCMRISLLYSLGSGFSTSTVSYLQKCFFAYHMNVSWTPHILYLTCAYHALIFKDIELILSKDLNWDEHCKATTACTY